jgi:hypothetical protein
MFTNRKTLWYSLIAMLVLIVAGACGPLPQPTQGLSPEAIYTQAAATFVAQLTQTASVLPVQPTSTATTVPPTEIPTATPTSVPPTATAVPPTATPVPPTNTPLPPTATPIPCNMVEFVRDVTVLDGTKFEPGQYFTKTWRLKNVGSCTWDTNYRLVYFSGSSLEGKVENKLTGSVKPGETVDVSVVLRAPSEKGKYTSNWMLRTGSGVLFGLGSNGEKPFWAIIEVTPKKEVIYDMAAKYCDAVWTSSSAVLPCPGTTSPTITGNIIRLDTPRLESGADDDEQALEMMPDSASSGSITGTFPAIEIKTGDRFRTVIGCSYGHTDCRVRFEVLANVDGSLNTLGAWEEKYEGGIVKVDLDLSSLAGKKVSFILRISNLGDSNGDVALWLLPRIMR